MTTSVDDEFLNEPSDSAQSSTECTSSETSTSGAYESTSGTWEPEFLGKQATEGDIEMTLADRVGPSEPVVEEDPLT